MNVQEVDSWGWRGLQLRSDHVSLMVAPEAGGRIISLTLDNVEALFSMPELRGRRTDLSGVTDVRAKKRELGWLHYGGYKTWLAPQERWTDGLPFLDLDSSIYDYGIQDTGRGPVLHLESPVCRETGMQLARDIFLSPDGTVVVQHSMTNRSDEVATWGLWDVTQVQGPGVAVLPLAQESRFEAGVKGYPNEGRSLTVMSKYVKTTNGNVAIICRQREPFKYGTDSMAGWIVGLLDRGEDSWLGLLKMFDSTPGASYPHEVTAEVYDSGTYPYFELEVHSPLITLLPGTTYGYSETWMMAWVPKSRMREAVESWVSEARSHGVATLDFAGAEE